MKQDLPDIIENLLENYFHDLEGEKPNAVYEMVLRSVEKTIINLYNELCSRQSNKSSRNFRLKQEYFEKKARTL